MNLKLKFLILTALGGFLLLAIPALAQTPVSAYRPALVQEGISIPEQFPAPGSFWAVVGNPSPFEKGVTFADYLEQGITLYRVGRFSFVPYVSGSADADTYGYDWNNYVQVNGGAKVNILVPHGLIDAGVAYSYQDRFRSGTSFAAPTYYVSDWFGWQSPRTAKSRFPGDTWGTMGHVTPVEPGNYLFTAYIEQGVIAKRSRFVTVVPIAVGTFSKDTKGYSWNNFTRTGGGVDFVLPKGTDLLATYLYENRSGLGSANGFSLTLKIWRGWTLKGRN